MTSLHVIELSGDSFERGRHYGSQVSAEIRQNVETYLLLIEARGGMRPEAARQAAQAFEPIIEAHAPDLLEEMRGIADGAGCDLTDVLLINTRSELMGNMDECTALAVAPERTSGDEVLLGQNWDWFTAVKPDPVLLRIRQEGKPQILTLAEAGQVGKIGMNSAGLGVCLNFLSHAHRGQGLPVHVILRQMLGCDNLGSAILTACSVPRGGAANILVAHREGEILDLELTPTDVDYIYGDAGWLVHTNHFESPRLRAGDTGMATSASTLSRAARARRLLAAAATGAEVSRNTFHRILTDHAYGPCAICRHPEPTDPPLQQSATRAAAIMNLTSRTLYLTVGQACKSAYHSLFFDSN